MSRLSLPAAASLAALLCATAAWAQTEQAPAIAPSAAPKAATKPVRKPVQPKAKTATVLQATPTPAPPQPVSGRAGQTAALASALGPDLASSVGIPKTIFVQRFVAETVYRFDRENRRSITLEQLNASVSTLEKAVRDGADRWWNESDRTKAGRVSRDDAQAAATDQFRKLTGLAAEQTETKQQSGIRESFERGAAQQFAKFDVNGDGFVVRDEVERRIAEETDRVERSARIARTLVEDGSRGRRGFLDNDKATILLGDVFDALDVNHDGTLSADELPAPKTAGRPSSAVRPPETAGAIGNRPVTSTGSAPAPGTPGVKRQAPTKPALPKSEIKAGDQTQAAPQPKPRTEPRKVVSQPARDLFSQPLPSLRSYRTAEPAESR